ncbi:hypothetical protein M413DRAFT_441350 [Hebeloma cylindrosporum]|uniref:Protein FAF1 n=1 Tax=Hebeloma cylindrosporum TaxID=76867 RepID=A0A0C3CBU8_HEBCY|nr:hypothetical protein M413DRAFT_441350 [Hebeloma cylindrosporum h7]
MSAQDENTRLLKILEGHGQSFLDSFSALNHEGKKRKSSSDKANNREKKRKVEEPLPEEQEEWFGINFNTLESGEHSGDEEGCDQSGSEFEHTDDEFTDKILVFSDPSAKNIGTPADHTSRAQMKAFMSSKISKLTSTSLAPTKSTKTPAEEEDRTNARNDALLHKLVHTKLLSGSLTTELDLSPAMRKKALAGRVLELTGEAKLGKGEKLVRNAEKNKAAKRVREGLSHKQKVRGKKELEEAKNLGNYHPTLKRVFEATTSRPATRKREKGLKMGVGKFSNGSLRLSRDDVDKAMGGFGSGSPGPGRSRGSFERRK